MNQVVGKEKGKYFRYKSHGAVVLVDLVSRCVTTGGKAFRMLYQFTAHTIFAEP